MFTNVKCSIYAGQDKVYTESVCLSTDTKPATGIANGSVCIEMNTGKRFMFDEDSGEWVEVPSSGGGGGGGGDFSTAQVTLIGTTPQVTDVPNAGNFPYIDNDEIVAGGNSLQLGTYTVVLYKGSMKFTTMMEPVSTTGAISEFEEVGRDLQAIITGDCSMTFDEIV